MSANHGQTFTAATVPPSEKTIRYGLLALAIYGAGSTIGGLALFARFISEEPGFLFLFLAAIVSGSALALAGGVGSVYLVLGKPEGTKARWHFGWLSAIATLGYGSIWVPSVASLTYGVPQLVIAAAVGFVVIAFVLRRQRTKPHRAKFES